MNLNIIKINIPVLKQNKNLNPLKKTITGSYLVIRNKLFLTS